MVAKIHWIGSLRKYRIQIFMEKNLFLEAYTKTFTEAVRIIEKFKGERLCVR